MSARKRRTIRKISMNNVIPLICSSLLSFSVSAADTEIYTDVATGATVPNVLFIMDTSDSMGTPVTAVEDYDSDADYPAPATALNVCDPLKLYWKTSRQPVPDCETTKNQSFAATTNRCESSKKGLDKSGAYTDRWSRYSERGKTWATFNASANDITEHKFTECRNDQKGHENSQSDPRPETHGLSYSGSRWATNAGDDPYSTVRQAYLSSNLNIWIATFWRPSSGISDAYTVYTGHYLNYYHHKKLPAAAVPPASLPTRMDIVKQTLTELIAGVPSINAGLMQFGNNTRRENSGGSVTYAMTDLGSNHRPVSGKRGEMNTAINRMNTIGATPLAETLHEAYRYWSGGAVLWGNNAALPSVAESRNGGATSNTYLSPINPLDCSANHQVLLTDGEPTKDTGSDAKINALISAADTAKSWIGGNPLNTEDHCDGDLHNTTDSNGCLDDLAEYMNKVDLFPASAINHTVVTHTIGFHLESKDDKTKTLLDLTAEHGGGEYYEASDAKGLENVFLRTIHDILESEGSFSSPAISVNALNRLVHNDELYFALFEPEFSARWQGNIKRYKLDYVEDDDEFKIVDRDDKVAIDPDTAQIKKTAISWWRLGNTADGNDVPSGGLAERLFDYDGMRYDRTSRKDSVFTYVEDYALGAFDGSGKELIVLHPRNSAIQVAQQSDTTRPIHRSHFGLEDNPSNSKFVSNADFKKLLKWSRGVDAFDEDVDGDSAEGRAGMGAPLHAKPVVVTYDSEYDTDTNTATQTNVIFSMTNDGYFHAAMADDPDGKGGTERLEHFAFIPRTLLPKLQSLQENKKDTEPIYGLDGGLTIWRNDADRDGNIVASSDSDDRVIAYFGQRRGGRAYFALDATDLTTPKLLWVIDPDSPAQKPTQSKPNRNRNLSHLGQSWAAPVRVKMRIADANGSLKAKDVLILAGGYDADKQDTAGSVRNSGDDVGNAIYIVDARTAEVYWWANKPWESHPRYPTDDDSDSLKDVFADMKWGFAGAIKPVDINGDEIIDMMFAADLGGQIWRFDIKNNNFTAAESSLKARITGGVIADLQKHTAASPLAAANNRRFYYSPDIALVALGNDKPYFTIAIGSGYRAHPLDTSVNDRFYVLKDYAVSGPPTETDENGAIKIKYTKQYEDKLQDITTLNLADKTVQLSDSVKGHLKNGWYLKFGLTVGGKSGEKVLANAVTLAGNIIFTTYTPPTGSNNPTRCTADIGDGAAYIMRIDDGRPVADLAAGGGSELEEADRKQILKSTGIPAEPLPIYTEGPNGNQAIVLVGKETLDINESASAVRPKPSYWYQKNLR